jgi:hypothetical protein
LAVWVALNCRYTGSYCMIEASIPVLAVGYGQNRFVGMHDSQVTCVNYKIVHRNMDNETVEESLDDTVGIAF